MILTVPLGTSNIWAKNPFPDSTKVLEIIIFRLKVRLLNRHIGKTLSVSSRTFLNFFSRAIFISYQ